MHIFRISFLNQGKIYVLFAENVRQAELYGFVEIDRLIFGEGAGVVIDPAEERLKSEFAGVNRVLIPMHAVLRIDEVEKRGQSKILDIDPNSNVSFLPSAFFRPERPPER
jgi:hypothetical protein